MNTKITLLLSSVIALSVHSSHAADPKPVPKSQAQALAVGLNAVNPANYDGWDGRLGGCENDVKDMLAIAKSQGFNVESLLTSKATRSAFRNAILQAAETLEPGGIFVLSYSGHGDQAADTNGDEPDGLDETLLLYDGELCDDEMAELWTHFKDGVRIVYYTDSCHSATQYKGKTDDRGPWPYRGPRSSQSELLIALPANRALDKGIPREPISRAKTVATVITISACGDTQLAGDAPTNGAFTGRLKSVWKNGTFSGTYKKFQNTIRSGMPTKQQPEYHVHGKSNPTFEAQKPWTIK